jgi:peptidoglycan/xylan/chitin deacetylase (PgdA/CDA1 family)
MTGFSPCLFRAPYGLVSPQLVLVARILGMTTVGWDVDPKDWREQTPGAVASSILRGTKGGSFVLLHVGGPDRRRTVSALELALPTLTERGFRFPTVSEALGYDPRVDDPAVPPTGR